MSEYQYTVLGLMSGTSLDGLDICHCGFNYSQNSWNYQILHTATKFYSDEWRSKLKFNPQMSASELLTIDHQYGLLLADMLRNFLDENKLDPRKISFIGSHGHTMYHQPSYGISLQLGNGPELFTETGIPTISNFRAQDVALGGQGAPLVPIGDAHLFKDYDACLNLGGFANISFTRNQCTQAFDLCPANYVLNSLAEKLGLPYDRGGLLASSGRMVESIFDRLNQLEYYSAPPPKSLGAEWVESYIDPVLQRSDAAVENLLHTYIKHISYQTSLILNKNGIRRCLVTGGGAYNDFLIKNLRESSSCEIYLPDDQLIQFKEALIFAFMAVLRIRKEVNVLASVTGSSYNHSSGVIHGI